MKTLGIILILCISLGLSSNGQDRRSWEDTGKQENKKSDVQDFRINVINGSFYDEQNLEYDAQAIAYKIDKNKESTFTFIVNSPDDNVVAKKVVHDFFVKGYNVKVIAPKVIPPTPSKQVSANTDIQNFRINVSNGLF